MTTYNTHVVNCTLQFKKKREDERFNNKFVNKCVYFTNLEPDLTGAGYGKSTLLMVLV